MDVAEQRALRQGYLLGLRQAQADPGYGRANRTPNTLQNIPITEEDKDYCTSMKVRKRTMIRNRYSQAPHVTQDTNGTMATSQLDITNEDQEVSPFPAGDHKASINRRTQKQNKNKTEITLRYIKESPPWKEQLGVQRNRALRLWKKLGIVSLILSSIAIIAGSIQMSVGPYFPYNLGAPVVAGAMSFLLAILCLCAVKEGRKYPTGDITGDRFRCLVFSYALLAIFAAVGSLYALAISGVMGLSDCNEENLAQMENPCLPDFKPILIGLSVLVIVTCGLLIIINIIGAGCYCNKPRAFGFVSGYEALMTSQTRMFSETQRGRHQYGSSSQQAAAEYQSDSGGGNQSMQSQVQPSAPPTIGEGANEDEEEYSRRKSIIKEVPPPSYDEVMMKQ